MVLSLVSSDEVIKEDKRNSRKRYLPTDAVCLRCGCINNIYYYDSCTICECKCGNDHLFIAGKLGIDLRMLLDLSIDELRMMCETRGIVCSSRSVMTVRLLRDFHYWKDFDKLITAELIRKILKRNIKKFRFTLDIVNEDKNEDNNANKKNVKGLKLKLIDAKDVMME